MRRIVAVLGTLGAAAIAIGARGLKRPRPQEAGIVNDLGVLSPVFREKLELLLGRMAADGFDHLVWETYRSPERALELEQRGTGVRLSQHTLGLAADIIDRRRYWNASPAFVAALHRHALELGLGRVDGDAWHVQALPPKFDAKMRAMVPAQRDAFLRAEYARGAIG
jgi:hypothetical protein